jgi:hypothetical protein
LEIPSFFGKAYTFQASIFMKNRFTILFFLVLLCQTARAATPNFYQLKIYSNKWSYGNRDSFLNGIVKKTVLEQLDSIYKKTPGTYEFHYSKETNSLKVLIQCSLDFYTVVDGKLIKDYQFQNRGYNCGSNLFLKEGNYYLLGGKGFWTNHLDLLRFDTQAGSWEFTQTKNQALDYFPIGVFHTEKGITTLFGDYSNPRIPRLEKESQGFFLDWEQKTWLPIRFETQGLNLSEIITSNPSYFLETQDYGLLVSNTQLPSLGWNMWVLIEKVSGKLFLYEGPKSNDALSSPYREVIENKIFFFDFAENSNTEGKEVTIDLEEAWKNSKEIGQITYLESPVQQESSRKKILAISLAVGIFLLLGGVTGWWYVNRQKKTLPVSIEEVEKEDESLLDKLLEHDGKKLTTEEFDRILGIHEISNFDSKRIKRARLIKGINLQYEEKKGVVLITRIKNPEDKRFVYYQIRF